MSSSLAHQIEDSDGNFDLGGFDLNLLLVLNALLRFRNLTHAGKELQLSQPATSRALFRLRQMFNDDLLTRGNRAFELTPLAETLAPKVEAALGNISTIFSGRIQAPERFSVAMPDHLGLLLVGNLSGYFREVSPTTVFIPVVGLSNVISQMEDGRIDLVLGITNDTPSGFFCRSLPPVPTVCLSRKGHPVVGGKIAYSDLGQFLSLRISSTYNTGFGEAYDGLEALRPRGRQTLTVPDIHTAARLVQETDAVLVLPVPSARFLAERYGLETFVPLKGVKPAPYQISMVWHERWHRNSIHAGVRSMIASYILEG
ncbi:MULTISPECIES: LysR family transcriptional regulator [unclassified Neorhizobium]|uniref:LysR family transcriptional regulator n=1 Tax=unclassified Neorhizobium TaxID=2629175 RepID=UPI001FF3CF86|nr:MULTISPECIES: LysR family transcriptional regulator [unclassified Neorhizobium]MCJ9671598.1 LysR family transcriptional regulator [Neorhizobium sp. SHOUNA12B]MCJ9747727.1 LysR family transcriptional regulator [Neorhizobium sp. SHOUNA12A]